MAIETTVKTITPAMAVEWLGHNAGNRNLRQPLVDIIAADIEHGDYVLNGESIKFDDRGGLLDGQHRLAAIVKAGRSIDSVVITGLPRNALETIDVGAKRSLADMLALRGEKNCTHLAAAISAIWLYERRPLDLGLRGGGGRYSPSVAEAMGVLAEHPGIRESAAIGKNVAYGAGLRAGIASPAHYITTNIDAADADAFWESLATGADLASDSSILKLRESLANVRGRGIRGGGLSSRYLWALTIKSWNYYRRGDPMTNLRWRAGGAAPEAFPEFE